MRVMTMDGGFRGLHRRGFGDLEGARGAAGAWFTGQLVLFETTLERLVEAHEAGLLPASDADRLDARYAALTTRIGAHMAALDRFVSEASVQSWRTVSAGILVDVNAWVNDVRRIIGDERGGRMLRTGLLFAGAALLFGGGAYAAWRWWG